MEQVFASDVFTFEKMRKSLPNSSHQEFIDILESGKTLDERLADQIANAMKEWALSKGATHFTHWFQPMTGLTAEKHDSFLHFDGDHLITKFSGKELIVGEPDASSFPSGGIRSTFEARGYTAWDMTSPAFVRRSKNGNTLFIPTAFCSWTGEALDKKTPLLRSQEALSREGIHLLHVIGENDVKFLIPTLGIEQEFFLVDRAFCLARPDLVASGRTLLGAKPPKGQELDDHYFGAMNPRILACLQEAEWELWRLGVPTRTRHNEAAPSQYEMAPIFEHASIASDHNMLVMEVLREVAVRHGFTCLLHEKPFAGVNGSGKHCNWSIATDKGENLLDPGKSSAENLRFVVILTAVLRAVDLHGDLLRVSVVSPGNDFRLGANEAPPAIMSIYLGAELDELCQTLMTDMKDSSSSESLSEGKPAKKRSMKLGVNAIPAMPRDTTDRNRTSPFAFTGNKFEFRAVGASQTASHPVMMVNTIVAESLRYMADEIERLKNGGASLQQAVQTVVKQTLTKHYRIVFNGNNYAQEWVVEAERRGIPNLNTTAVALAKFGTEKNFNLFSTMHVLSRPEVAAWRNIMYENYIKTLSIEATSLHSIASTMVLPAAIKYQGQLAQSIQSTVAVLHRSDGAPNCCTPQMKLLRKLTQRIDELIDALEQLQQVSDEGGYHHADSDHEQATQHYNEIVRSSMAKVRVICDAIEMLIDDGLWPLPKYSEMLFLR